MDATLLEPQLLSPVIMGILNQEATQELARIQVYGINKQQPAIKVFT